MFEISDLKSKKLPELQEIAKTLNVSKYKTLKKLDLVYQILDVQASTPKSTVKIEEEKPDKPEKKILPKLRRARVERDKNGPKQIPKPQSNPTDDVADLKIETKIESKEKEISETKHLQQQHGSQN